MDPAWNLHSAIRSIQQTSFQPADRSSMVIVTEREISNKSKVDGEDCGCVARHSDNWKIVLLSELFQGTACASSSAVNSRSTSTHHITHWGKNTEEQLDPNNGHCCSRLEQLRHEAFARGLSGLDKLGGPFVLKYPTCNSTSSRGHEEVLREALRRPIDTLEMFLRRANEKDEAASSSTGQRLVDLTHACHCFRRSEDEEGGTPGEIKCPFPRCKETRKLWMHMLQCGDAECSYPLCTFVTRELRHLQTCQSLECPLCGPVKDDIQKESGVKLACFVEGASRTPTIEGSNTGKREIVTGTLQSRLQGMSILDARVAVASGGRRKPVERELRGTSNNAIKCPVTVRPSTEPALPVVNSIAITEASRLGTPMSGKDMNTVIGAAGCRVTCGVPSSENDSRSRGSVGKNLGRRLYARLSYSHTWFGDDTDPRSLQPTAVSDTDKLVDDNGRFAPAWCVTERLHPRPWRIDADARSEHEDDCVDDGDEYVSVGTVENGEGYAALNESDNADYTTANSEQDGEDSVLWESLPVDDTAIASATAGKLPFDKTNKTAVPKVKTNEWAIASPSVNKPPTSIIRWSSSGNSSNDDSSNDGSSDDSSGSDDSSSPYQALCRSCMVVGSALKTKKGHKNNNNNARRTRTFRTNLLHKPRKGPLTHVRRLWDKAATAIVRIKHGGVHGRMVPLRDDWGDERGQYRVIGGGARCADGPKSGKASPFGRELGGMSDDWWADTTGTDNGDDGDGYKTCGSSPSIPVAPASAVRRCSLRGTIKTFSPRSATEIILEQQQRLLVLLHHHALECSVPEKTDKIEGNKLFGCELSRHCASVRQLWDHVALCNDSQCVSHLCRNTSILLKHVYHCRFRARCDLCRVVWDTDTPHARASAPALTS